MAVIQQKYHLRTLSQTLSNTVGTTSCTLDKMACLLLKKLHNCTASSSGQLLIRGTSSHVAEPCCVQVVLFICQTCCMLWQDSVVMVKELFRDMELTEFIIATIPTVLGINESRRLLAALRKEQIPCRRIIINQVAFMIQLLNLIGFAVVIAHLPA